MAIRESYEPVATTELHHREKSFRGLLRGRLRELCMLAIMVFFFQDVTQAQVVVPDFEVDVVTVKGEDDPSETRVDIYTRVPITQISFINTPDGFTAGYEVKLDAIEWSDDNRLRNVVQSRIWDASVVVNAYAETQADARYDFTTQSLSLIPGKYLFEFEVADRNSNQTYVRSLPVVVKPMDAAVALSDITLLESYDEEDFTIVPRVNSRVGSDEGGFRVFYEVYSEDETDLSIIQEIRRTKEDGSANVLPEDIANGEIVETDLVYTKEELATLKNVKNQYIVTVPMEDFRVGTYSMRVTLYDAVSGDEIDTSERQFVVQWNGLADHIEDIDDAIAQMEYIAKKRDLSFIQDAPNQVERIQRFRNFWNKRDPTPGTRRNERMEEYYYRIAAANQNYGAVREGWKTDRGFVLVRFGEPDHVRRKPHSFDYEPYEIWVYERVGRQFIFVDKTGFGDYELLVPVWDERTRLY